MTSTKALRQESAKKQTHGTRTYRKPRLSRAGVLYCRIVEKLKEEQGAFDLLGREIYE